MKFSQAITSNQHRSFLLTEADNNPSINKDGRALNIDAIIMSWILILQSVGGYFRLVDRQMAKIINEVVEAVSS